MAERAADGDAGDGVTGRRRDAAIRAYTANESESEAWPIPEPSRPPVVGMSLDRSDDGRGHDHTFTADGLTVELSVRFERGGSVPIIDGVVHPAVDVVTVIVGDGEPRAVDCDRSGRFAVGDVGSAFVIVATAQSGVTVRTPTIDPTARR